MEPAQRDPLIRQQLVRAVAPLLLAVWLVAPWPLSIWERTTALAVLDDVLPRALLVRAAAAVGAGHVVAVRTGRWRWRRLALGASFLLWAFLLLVYVLTGETFRPIVPLLLGNAAQAAVFYVAVRSPTVPTLSTPMEEVGGSGG